MGDARRATVNGRPHTMSAQKKLKRKASAAPPTAFILSCCNVQAMRSLGVTHAGMPIKSVWLNGAVFETMQIAYPQCFWSTNSNAVKELRERWPFDAIQRHTARILSLVQVNNDSQLRWMTPLPFWASMCWHLNEPCGKYY